MNWGWLVYLVAIPVFAVIVLIHEFGHFITAKWAGIRVEEFGIGFPPRAFGIKRGETLYSVNWLPIGGFVRMPGENGETTDAEGRPDPGSFSSKPAYKRIIVLLAGVTMNLLLAIVLLGGADALGQVVDFQPVIGTVEANSPAAQAGLHTGDTILAVNGQTVKTWTTMTSDISAVTDNTPKTTTTVPVTLVVIHTGQTAPDTLTINVRAHPAAGEGHLGIGVNDAYAITTHIPFWQ
ncbi:MAG TPA: site-2 protease family protein, partial [Ktedonobacterales bacterium]